MEGDGLYTGGRVKKTPETARNQQSMENDLLQNHGREECMNLISMNSNGPPPMESQDRITNLTN